MNKKVANITIKPIQEIKICCRKEFFLVNGVAILSTGNIVVADGGNDRICLLNSNGDSIKSIGGKGFGKYLFKKPVGVFVSPDQKVYVADCHNHRIAIYNEDLIYVGEFGHYGRVNSSGSFVGKIKQVRRFLRNLSYAGTYVTHFFVSSKSKEPNGRYSFKLFLNGLLYWYSRNSSLKLAIKMILSEHDAIDKPNGVAFFNDTVVISQKNSKCLSLYRKKENQNDYIPVAHYFGPSDSVKFGRLCNLAYDSQGYLYICDERKNLIWKLNSNFEYIDTIVGQDSGMGEFLPFSCCFIRDDILAVCGGLNFQVIDLHSKELLYCSENKGELHGIAYDKNLNRLYIADRSNSVIHIFKVYID